MGWGEECGDRTKIVFDYSSFYATLGLVLSEVFCVPTAEY